MEQAQTQQKESQKTAGASKRIRRKAFIKTLPVMCSDLFIGLAYGMLRENAGFAWYYSLFTSFTVYTGAFQFVLVTFLSSGASLITVALTAFLMNSRQTFYSLSFIEDFNRMGKRKNYMIRTMTDETYALNCSVVLQGSSAQLQPGAKLLVRHEALTAKHGAVVHHGTFKIVNHSVEVVHGSVC